MRLGVDRIYGASKRREKSGLGVHLNNGTMLNHVSHGHPWIQAFFKDWDMCMVHPRPHSLSIVEQSF